MNHSEEWPVLFVLVWVWYQRMKIHFTTINFNNSILTWAPFNALWKFPIGNIFVIGAIINAIFITTKNFNGLLSYHLSEIISVNFKFKFVISDSWNNCFKVFRSLINYELIEGLEIFNNSCLLFLWKFTKGNVIIIEIATTFSDTFLIKPFWSNKTVFTWVEALSSTVLVTVFRKFNSLWSCKFSKVFKNWGNSSSPVEDQFSSSVLVGISNLPNNFFLSIFNVITSITIVIVFKGFKKFSNLILVDFDSELWWFTLFNFPCIFIS